MASIERNLQQAAKPVTFSDFMTGPGVKKKIMSMLGGERGNSFISGLVSSVQKNEALARCERGSILSAALEGAALNLSNTLGYYYLVPFNDRKNNRTVAQFQLGYKGYIQLAIRSGQYKRINVLAIKEGELIGYNPLTEELKANIEENDEVREKLPTIGYYASFEMINGFTKSMYCSIEKMRSHALKYSESYRSDVNKGNQYSFWSKNFDMMAYKTMLRRLLGQWGAMSVEMTRAMVNDMSVLNDEGEARYIDNEAEVVETTVNANQSDEQPTENPVDNFFNDKE